MSEIVLGGQTRRLAFTFPTLKRLEKERGLNLWGDKVDLLSPATMSALLWGALLVEEPTLTEAQADALVDLSRQGEIMSAVADAIVEALGGPADPLAAGASSSGSPASSPIASAISPGSSTG